MNPLPNRPLLNNPTMPLSLPNVPSFEQIPYNGRPRKILPSDGSNLLNGINLMSGPSSAPATSGPQIPPLERNNPPGSGILPQHISPPSSIPQSTPQAAGPSQPPAPLPATQNESDREVESESRQLTAIFRPDDAGEWKEKLRLSHEASEQARLAREGQNGNGSLWDRRNLEDEELKEEDGDVEDDESTEVGEGEGNKIWKAKRTLRKYACKSPPLSERLILLQSPGRRTSSCFPSNGIVSSHRRRRLHGKDMANGCCRAGIICVRPCSSLSRLLILMWS